MRTNIDIDQEILDELMKKSGLKTKKEIVNQALRAYLRIIRQREVLKYEGKIEWEGDLDQIRELR